MEKSKNKKTIFINPFTDFGFKKIFGDEKNTDLLKDFLNELLATQNQHIQKLTLKQNEKLGITDLDRKVVFDIYCENEIGEKFTVELQKAKQKFFKDRMIYYSSYSIQEQGEKNEWNYELKHVYVIAILDFVFDNKDADKIVVSRNKLMDIERNKVFYDKLTFVTLQMPNFTKELKDIETNFDKWLYIIKNLHQLDEIPKELNNKLFARLFKIASYSALSKDERLRYEDSIKYYNDLKNSLDLSKEEGKDEVRNELIPKLEASQKREKEAKQREEEAKQKIIELAIFLKKMNISHNEISEKTGLTLNEIENL